MSGPQAVPDVTEYGTGLLHTAVRALPDGHQWTRTVGPLAPAAFQPVTGLGDRLTAVGRDGAARLAVGRAEGRGRVYTVPGGESVANRLLSQGPLPQLREPMRGLGLALHRLHAEGPPPPTERLGPPRGLVRLDTWLAGRAPVARAAYVGDQLRHRLGPERWSRVTAWCREVAEDADVTLAHGAPGLGSLVAGGDGGPAALLTGEDLAVAPWYFDLGWVLGELVELKWQLGGDQQGWQLLLEALFEGYGRDVGAQWNRLAALRILLHVHDIAAYVGWHTAGFDHYATFLTFLVDL
ncbi:hypothetical protein OG562_18245 [Streptomyces sp. NBC_01275]|uniref:hypothetical protein n=1 Tax=Streptomyces sp. NBC_01275 TaxID=2903807 RepID=UPI0022596CE8|nr:hypothetical protein [Streptomyces sp. NBC_01275]MCX4762881.1 hypothetical protein [Streptomyces sp. NBC_01275]